MYRGKEESSREGFQSERCNEEMVAVKGVERPRGRESHFWGQEESKWVEARSDKENSREVGEVRNKDTDDWVQSGAKRVSHKTIEGVEK